MFEYEGEYACRYLCQGCTHRQGSSGDEYAHCPIQKVDIHRGNNICRYYESRIINQSAPKFNFDDYLEYLGSDYYRPERTTEEIIGSGRLGEAILDGGELAEMLPDVYSAWHRSEDLPYCKVKLKSAYVEYEGNKFTIDYARYREAKTVENTKIHFEERLWKDKPKARKYFSERNGKMDLKNN